MPQTNYTQDKEAFAACPYCGELIDCHRVERLAKEDDILFRCGECDHDVLLSITRITHYELSIPYDPGEDEDQS